jgi:hypothetical protein
MIFQHDLVRVQERRTAAINCRIEAGQPLRPCMNIWLKKIALATF